MGTTADGEYGGDDGENIADEEEEEDRNARIISNIHNFVIDDDDLDEDEILDRAGNISHPPSAPRNPNGQDNANHNERSGQSSLSQVELTAMPTATAVPLA